MTFLEYKVDHLQKEAFDLLALCWLVLVPALVLVGVFHGESRPVETQVMRRWPLHKRDCFYKHILRALALQCTVLRVDLREIQAILHLQRLADKFRPWTVGVFDFGW